VRTDSVEVRQVSTVITYRVHTATLAIFSLEHDRVPLTVPENALIQVKTSAFEVFENTVVEIEWNARMLMMFTEDLRTRASVVHVSTADKSEWAPQ
jgi:hypothetical protein